MGRGQNRKLGNLGYCSFTSNFASCCNLRFTNGKNELRQKLKGQDMLLEEKKIPRFSSFRFFPIPKMENSEISESCRLLQILTVVVTFSKFVFSRERERERERESSLVFL